jgi:glycosyltransferase involved in cell wall biosynthesis
MYFWLATIKFNYYGNISVFGARASPVHSKIVINSSSVVRIIRDMNEVEKIQPRQLRIALVTETYPPEINGVAITLGRMIDGLLERQHDIHVVRPAQGRQDKAKIFAHYSETLMASLPIPGYPELKFGLPAKEKLLRLWRDKRPDVVHIATEGPLGWSACSAAQVLGIPVCSDFHTNFHNYSQHYGVGWLNKPIESYLRRFHNRTQCTLVPTVSLQKTLSQSGYKNVHVISRGIDAARFHPDKRCTELRRQWGAMNGTPVAILVSRLAAEKNLSLVVEAFEKIHHLRPDSKLVMVGDGPARAVLQQRFPHIIFAGMRSGEDLARHYASADLFLYPSTTETYGNVTIEAMASGLLTLAYDYAAAREHIKHEINGLLAPFNDEHAFLALAQGILSDEYRLQRMRRNARTSVEHLSWENINIQLESILLKLAYSVPIPETKTQPTAIAS